MDDPTRHDSNCIVEIISLGLERVSEICRRQNRKMPRTLLVLADNTVRETKNQYVFSYINNLVAQRKMRLAGCMFLRKSHTDDRIDQVWGVLARRISNCDSLLDANDTIKVVRDELSRPGLRAWIGSNVELHVQKLDAVRDWKQVWKPQGIGLSGGLLEDASSNHVFLMMTRKGGIWPKSFITLNLQQNKDAGLAL